MTKETVEKLLEDFNKNLEERKELFYEIQSSEMTLEVLSKRPDVVTFLYLQNHLSELQDKLSQTTDDIYEYALKETYSRSSEEPFVWLYDYRTIPGLNDNSEPLKVYTYRDDNEGTHRVYLGLESLTPMDLPREAAYNFEQVNDIIVLEKYNNPQNCGLTPEVFNDYRTEYFTNILDKEKTKKKSK